VGFNSGFKGLNS